MKLKRLDTPRSNGERWIQCSPKVYVSADTSRRESGGPSDNAKHKAKSTPTGEIYHVFGKNIGFTTVMFPCGDRTLSHDWKEFLMMYKYI